MTGAGRCVIICLKSVSYKTLLRGGGGVTNKECKELLEGCLIFEGCADHLIQRVLEDPLCKRQCYKKGESLQYSGGALGILLKGRVGVGTLREGSALVLNQHEKGAVFGFSSLFEKEKQPFCSDLRAKCNSEVLWIGEELLLELMTADLRIAQNIISYQASKIRFLNRKIGALTLPCAEERLYLHLQSIQKSPCGMPLKSVNMTQLAKRLNISRASIYRVLDKLIEEGKIEKSGNTLIIKE